MFLVNEPKFMIYKKSKIRALLEELFHFFFIKTILQEFMIP